MRRLLSQEAKLWTCALTWPFRRARDESSYSYHRGFRGLVFVILAILVVEGALVELILSLVLGDSVWVWLGLALHLYAIVWMVGLLASLHLYPHTARDGVLVLNDGIYTRLEIRYTDIAGVVPARVANLGRSGLKHADGLALMAYGDATAKIVLAGEASVVINGKCQVPDFSAVAVTVDDPRRFCRELTAEIG